MSIKNNKSGQQGVARTLFIFHEKKGQVGETLTWIVATVVVIVILLFFVFGASLLAATKNIGNFKESLTSGEVFEGDDIFMKKSIYTYYQIDSDTNKRLLDNELKMMEERGEFNFLLNETRKTISNNLNRK